uniref:Uncharacterized protein n=1 Tax=Rhizophora mucronata TaxID=61149 RepID=A0A2P2PA31_RHIMU
MIPDWSPPLRCHLRQLERLDLCLSICTNLM